MLRADPVPADWEVRPMHRASTCGSPVAELVRDDAWSRWMRDCRVTWSMTAIWGGRIPVAREGRPVDRAIHTLSSPGSCVTSPPTARRRATEFTTFEVPIQTPGEKAARRL